MSYCSKILIHIFVTFGINHALLGDMLNNKTLCQIENTCIIFSMDIFNTCFPHKNEPIVVITDHNCTLSDLYSQVLIQLKIDKTDTFRKYKSVKKVHKLDPSNPLFKPFPARKFIIVGIKINLLKLALYKLKSSIWWNAEGLFIIENTGQKGTCRYALTYLQIAWEFNILHCVFVCRSAKSEIYLHSFNPYNYFAPAEWTRIHYDFEVHGHPFVWFQRKYDNEDATLICHNLNFDKTRTLNKYLIKLCVEEMFYIPTIKGDFKMRGITGKLMETLWTKLDAKVQLTIIQDSGFIDENGKPTGGLVDIFAGKFDMNTVFDYQRDIWKNELNTFIYTGACYYVRKEIVTISEHFESILSPNFLLLSLSLYSIITVLFAYYFETSISYMAIDVLRAVIGFSMLHEPKLLTRRITFLGFIVSFATLTLYLQTKLSSLVTAEPTRENKIHSVDDLLTYNYKVYLTDYGKQYYKHTPIYDQILKVNHFNECVKLLGSSDKIACPENCDLIKTLVKETTSTRILKDENLQYYFVLTFRDDFPLRKRMFQIYSWLYQNGIVHYFIDRVLRPKIYNDYYFLNRINYNQLKIAFSFLKLCLIFTIVIFLLEILKHNVYGLKIIFDKYALIFSNKATNIHRDYPLLRLFTILLYAVVLVSAIGYISSI